MPGSTGSPDAPMPAAGAGGHDGLDDKDGTDDKRAWRTRSLREELMESIHRVVIRAFMRMANIAKDEASRVANVRQLVELRQGVT